MTQQEQSDAEASPPNLGTIGAGAGIAALLLLLRVLAVADWDWNVAGHILDAFDFGSAVSVAVGTLFANAHLAAGVVAVITSVAIVGTVAAARRHSQTFGALAVAILGVVMLLSLALSTDAWWGLALAAVLTGAMVVALVLRSLGKVHDGAVWIAKRLGITVLVGMFALVIFVQEPWASPEVITMRDGSEVSGFVLKESPSGMHVLVDGGDVEILMNSDVIQRDYR